VLGSELIQFGDAMPLGNGRFRLQRLLRGRGGTEWAVSRHEVGDNFLVIERASVQSIRLPRWAKGSEVAAALQNSGAAAEITLSAESLRPPTPTRLRATTSSGGGVEFRWERRSRHGWAWIDEVDAPIGESREAYEVTVIGSTASLKFVASQAQLMITREQLSAAGTGPATVQLRQIGVWAVSRPAELNLVLS
jgi:hypothetical protein